MCDKITSMRSGATDRTAMMAMIEQWKTSGMRQKDFYQQHNIPAHVFYYWHKRYRVEHSQQEILSPSGPFVQLHPAVPVPTNNIELLLPDGTRILFHEPVSAQYLKALLG